MKKIMAIFFCLTFLGIGCNLTNGPDPIVPIVSVNGIYERVYPITNPEQTQPVQIVFEKQDSGAPIANAKEVSENVYSFRAELYATYPNGAWYKMRALDYKLGDMYSVGKKLILNGYEFQSGDNGYVKFRLDKDGTVYELFD